MSTIFAELADRIRGELSELKRAVDRVSVSWAQAERTSSESAYLDSVALNLHGFYSGLERLFELIARHIDAVKPTGETWHRDLLQRMSQDVKEVRPAVLGLENARALDEFRRFRHLVRNVYTMNLSPKRLEPLVSALPALWASIRDEMSAFAEFVEALAEAGN